MSQINNLPKIQNLQNVHDKYKNIPKPYMDVAEGMETQFTNHLLNEMRKTIPSSTPESSATKLYKSLQDAERAQMMAKSQSGIGVKDLVLDQIYPQHMRVDKSKHANVKMYKETQKQPTGASHE